MNLIDRKCKCGCEMIFKCLENSGQRYYSKIHMEAQHNKDSESGKSKLRRGEPDPRSKYKTVPTRETTETENFINL